MVDPKAPVTLLDLTEPSQQDILIDLLESRPPDYIHLGMPCGTASRAREKPISISQRRLGAPNPQPLRSAQYPLGLPHINPESTAGIRLAKANSLYRFAAKILRIAMRHQSIVSLENPHRSWFWAAMLAIILDTQDKQLIAFWDSLAEVFFHNCCHGGQRRKGTRWKSSPGVFAPLQAECQNDHPHLPYQVQQAQGQWSFDTAAEAAYPVLLTNRVAALAKEFLHAQGYTFVPRPLPRINTLAVQHRQHRRRAQLIPEFSRVTWLPPETPLTEFQKVLPSSSQGELEEEVAERTNSQMDFKLVGTWHTPEEFVDRAKRVTHPMDEHAVEQITREAVKFVVQSDPRLVSVERRKNLLKAKIKAKQLEDQERALHASLEPSVEKVVFDKRILLWKALLLENDYDDVGVVDFLVQGVPLVGAHDHPSCYSLKVKPASMTEQELRESAKACRRALESRRPQTDQPGFARHLEETADKEVSMSFLEGPYGSPDEVSAVFGHDNWRVMRRFVIEQGSKLRPIDDGLEAQLNAAYSSTIRLDLQDADYVIALTLLLGQSAHLNWVGKTLDLSKVYKQLAVLPKHRDLAVVLFRGQDGQPRYYVPNALMFGSTAAVYAFNRVSRSLWFLLNKYLHIPCAVYFDDYPMFSPKLLAVETDQIVSEFLDLLGWRHDRTGPKGKPFEDTFDVLGMTLSLEHLPTEGNFSVQNKLGRVDKIVEKVTSIKSSGRMSLAEAQELHGLLNFATGYFAGRSLKYACFKIFSLVDNGGTGSKKVSEWCEDVLSLLRAAQPRTVPVTLNTRTALVFTDGSWENGIAGLGAVLLDESSGVARVVQDRVCSELLDIWRDVVGDHLICQIELLAMVLIRWEFKEELALRRTLLFVDNNSARGGVLKGRSSSLTMDDLVRAFYAVEAGHPAFWWIERVPSKSNPSDEPSRFEGKRAATLWGAPYVAGFRCFQAVAQWLIKAHQQRAYG